jgi:hypothetical protein
MKTFVNSNHQWSSSARDQLHDLMPRKISRKLRLIQASKGK